MNDNKRKSASQTALGGMFWTFAERISAQLVTLIVSIVLARILSPDEYSIVAIVTVFVTIANIFVTAGFGSALVQKLNTDNIDFSTTLYFSFGFSIIIYIILFFAAPFIASFYDIPLLTPVVRVMSIRIVIASINSVQQAYISKTLQFRKFFYSTLTGTVVSAVVGITMALTGFGVWALVAQYLTNVTIDTCVLSFTSGWKPQLVFSAKRMKSLYSFGWKVMMATAVHTIVTQARSLVLSKVTTPTELSYYNQGEKFPSLFINNIETSIQKVMAPILSAEQNDKTRVLDLTRKAMRVSTFTIWPLLIGLAAVAESLIELLYTSKWSASVPYMKLICLAFLFYPVGETHVRTIRAIGRSDITMWTVTSSDAFNIILLVVAIFLKTGGKGIVVSWIIASIMMAVVNGIADQKLIGYKLRDQVMDIAKTALCVALMYVIVQLFRSLNINLFLKLIIQVLIGGMVYLGISFLVNRNTLLYVLRVGKKFIKKKH